MSKKNIESLPKEEKTGKKNKLFLGIGIVFIIVLAAVVIGFFALKDQKKEKPVDKLPEQEEKEPEDPVEEIPSVPDYYMLINSLNIAGLPKEYFGYFFQKESYTKEEVQNQVKIYMAIRQVIAENADQYQDPSKELQIKQADVEKAVKAIFGKDTKIQLESLKGNSCNYSAFQYDKKKKLYIQKPGECSEDQTMSILMEQSNMEILEDKVIFVVKAVFVDFTYNAESGVITYEYYNDISKKLSLGSSEQYDIGAFRDKAFTYQFTFIKDKGQYAFEKVERIAG